MSQHLVYKQTKTGAKELVENKKFQAKDQCAIQLQYPIG